MKDPSLESYTEAIEGHLRARRGVDHVLSPRDFSLARQWHQAGIPLATVLVGIDLAFDSGQQVTSLAYCRRRVEGLASCGPLERRISPLVESLSLGEVAEVLQGLYERLAALRPGRQACFEPSLRKIEEVRELLAVAARPNWDYVRAKLSEIDGSVASAVEQSLSEDERLAYEAEARRAVERHKERMDQGALKDAVDRFVIHRARERLGLVRVGLL